MSPVASLNPAIPTESFPQSRNPDGFYRLIPILTIRSKTAREVFGRRQHLSTITMTSFILEVFIVSLISKVYEGLSFLQKTVIPYYRKLTLHEINANLENSR